MFQTIQLSDAANNEIRCNWLMNSYNDAFLSTVSQFKNQWIQFWDPNLTVVQMQAQLDFLATSGALSAYFTKALNLITYLLGEDPHCFDDSIADLNGAIQPNGQPYKRFLTPGWIYTVDGSGRMIVSAPCSFTNQGGIMFSG